MPRALNSGRRMSGGGPRSKDLEAPGPGDLLGGPLSGDRLGGLLPGPLPSPLSSLMSDPLSSPLLGPLSGPLSEPLATLYMGGRGRRAPGGERWRGGERGGLPLRRPEPRWPLGFFGWFSGRAAEVRPIHGWGR